MKKILLLTVLIGMMVMMVVYIIDLDKDPDKDPDKPYVYGLDYFEEGNLLCSYKKRSIDSYMRGAHHNIPIVMLQDYPPFTAPNGTVWIKDIEFDGKYLTYTERKDHERGFGVLVSFLDEYGNEARIEEIKEKEDGVWRTVEGKLKENGRPGDGRYELEGEVVEIHFHEIYDGYNITWIYEVRDRGLFCFF